MLIVEGLHRPRNVVIGADSLLHILTIVDIFLFYFIALLLVASRRQEEGENGLSLLKVQRYRGLEVLHCQLLLFFGCGFELLLKLVLGLGLGSA